MSPVETPADGKGAAEPAPSGATMTEASSVPTTRKREIARDQGDVALVASVVQFEQSVRRLLTANGGPRMHRWPAQGETPGNQNIGVAFIGPELDIEAMADRAEHINRVNAGIYLVLVSDPRPGLFERALRAGVRDVIAPSASDDAIIDALERGFDHAARWRASSGSGGGSANEKRKEKRIFTVLSPKGGVGKTFCATNIAMALNLHEPGKVAVIDLDLQFGDVAGAMHLSPEHTVADAARGMMNQEMNATNSMVKVFLTAHESGIYVMCSPEDPAEADEITYEQSIHITKALSGSFDYVVVDTCAGLDPHALSIAEISTDLIFVCSVDVSSVRSLRRELDSLDRLGMTHQARHLVLNRYDAPGGARPEDVEVAVGLKASVMIPADRYVLAAANQGIPITSADPKSAIARKFMSLSETLAEIEQTAPGGTKPKAPFWRRAR